MEIPGWSIGNNFFILCRVSPDFDSMCQQHYIWCALGNAGHKSTFQAHMEYSCQTVLQFSNFCFNTWICTQNLQAKQEGWPQLYSYNVQEKRDLLATLVAVRGSSLQYCTITLAEHARLKSCEVPIYSQHVASWRECVRSKEKNYYDVLSNNSRKFSYWKVTDFLRSWNKNITIIFLAAILPQYTWCWESYLALLSVSRAGIINNNNYNRN